MKTKPWSPPPNEQLDNAPADYPIDLPCLMWAGGQGPIGPFPLTVCMLKGLQLARITDSSFAIRGEASMRTIIMLADGNVNGDPVVVRNFMAQHALAENIFAEVVEETKAAVAAARKAAAQAQQSPSKQPKNNNPA